MPLIRPLKIFITKYALTKGIFIEYSKSVNEKQAIVEKDGNKIYYRAHEFSLTKGEAIKKVAKMKISKIKQLVEKINFIKKMNNNIVIIILLGLLIMMMSACSSANERIAVQKYIEYEKTSDNSLTPVKYMVLCVGCQYQELTKEDYDTVKIEDTLTMENGKVIKIKRSPR